MLRRSIPSLAGVSGMSTFFPPCSVDLKNWCEWTPGQQYDKVSAVVGKGFRCATNVDNAYTMAASATLRLIQDYNIDPQQVGQLYLGTESATDNSAGAVIVRGMVDAALEQLGKPRLSRNMEVQEIKHACCSAVMALGNAARYCETDGADRLAIVVASDVAHYVRGSSGEVTSGAGAVASLVERCPKLFDVNMRQSGSASMFRGCDFRKPLIRAFAKGSGFEHEPEHGAWKIADAPVFSGNYSTIVYVDTTAAAVENMLDRLGVRPSEYYANTSMLLLHRPYAKMPVDAMCYLVARAYATASSVENRAKFEKLCAEAKVKPDDVVREVTDNKVRDLYHEIQRQLNAGAATPVIEHPYPNTQALAKAVGKDKEFRQLLEKKMSLGAETVMYAGNTYTASVFAWAAAAFEDAASKQVDLTGKPGVLVGYGSGDASLSIPIVPVKNWQEAARKINIKKELFETPVRNLTKDEYLGLHSGKLTDDIALSVRRNQFVIDRLGTINSPTFQDLATEYYKYIQ